MIHVFEVVPEEEKKFKSSEGYKSNPGAPVYRGPAVRERHTQLNSSKLLSKHKTFEMLNAKFPLFLHYAHHLSMQTMYCYC